MASKVILTGWITQIVPVNDMTTKVVIKTCEKGYKTASGHQYKDRIDYHLCYCQKTLSKFVLNGYRIGNFVEAEGVLRYQKLKTKNGDIYRGTIISLYYLNLFNAIEIKEDSKEALNAKAIGDIMPDSKDSFENDF